MVVGGVDHFVGSDASRAGASIAAALARPADVGITVASARPSADVVSLHYAIAGGLPDRAALWAAVVQRSATVRVERGENSGRTLNHTNVVRALVEAPVSAGSREGDVIVRMPWIPAASEADAVVLVQRASGPYAMAVLGASITEVPPFTR
jgi:hypothetical protein